MTTELGRVTVGLLKALDLSGVANGTDLHNTHNWKCFRSSGAATGLFDVQSGEIHSTDNVNFAMALWGDPDVAHPGHCIRGEVMSPTWGSLVAGFCANGTLDHGYDVRGFLGNSWELSTRNATPGDYGEGFVITSGTTPGQPLTNSTYYQFLMAAVQQPPPVGTHTRGGSAYASSQLLAFDDSTSGLSTGLNDGSNTYPGVYYYNAPGARWRNIVAYKDYRITVNGLSSSMAFRLFDNVGGTLGSSGTQSGGTAHVNVHLLSWPITGFIQVYSDNTYAIALPGGRWPSAGNATDIVGGDVFDQVPVTGFSVGIQVNWDDSQDTPDNEWAKPGDDVTADLVDMDLSIVAANPRIEVDTMSITLHDPDGKYVPANISSSLYPNVRLSRECRAILTVDGTSAARFYGTIAEYQPQVGQDAVVGIQTCLIRVESPLRALASCQVILAGIPSGVLVNADGVTGVIPTILALIPDIIPPITWDLDPTPDSIDAGFLTQGMTVQTALEQCAIFADSIYFINPFWKRSTLEPNFHFRWKARGITQAAFADHVWTDTGGDIGRLQPRYTGDII